MIDLTKAMTAVQGDSEVPFHFKMAKLMEEVGELNQAYLAREQAANASKTAKEKPDLDMEVIEEAIDSMLVAFDITMAASSAKGLSIEEIQSVVDRKIEKWLSKQK